MYCSPRTASFQLHNTTVPTCHPRMMACYARYNPSVNKARTWLFAVLHQLAAEEETCQLAVLARSYLGLPFTDWLERLPIQEAQVLRKVGIGRPTLALPGLPPPQLMSHCRYYKIQA